MKVHGWIVLAVVSNLLSLSCKKAETKEESEVSARLASGQDVQITVETVPEPKLTAKQKAEDLVADNFQLSEATFPREDIGKHQIAGSSLTGTPRPLQGIWWLDGNPVADETITFAHVDFTVDHPLLTVFGTDNFSFHAGMGPSLRKGEADRNDKQGMGAYHGAESFNIIYEFQFTDKTTYASAKIIPTLILPIGLIKKRIRVPQRIASFGFDKTGENEYTRTSSFVGKSVDDYYARRILIPSEKDPNVLEPTEFWDDYLAAPGSPRLRLAVRK